MVRLTEEDFVCSRAGTRRADYRPQVADRSQASFDDVCRDLKNLAAERGVSTIGDLEDIMLSGTVLTAMIREVMRVRYDRELARDSVATA